ncbi:MAG: hypothetical protein HW416_331 [Chloroflexi bacterium]|nr:hypothetical protein [Chloroflexota bacterium]
MNIEFVLRFVGGILAAIGSFQVFSNVIDFPKSTYLEFWLVYAICSATFGIGYMLTPYVTTRPFFWLRHRIYHATASEVLAAGIGLAFGLLVGALLAFPLSFLPGNLGRALPVVSSVALAYLGVVTMLTHKRAILEGIGIGGRKLEGNSGIEGRKVLVDTSAIIDGRIADVGRTGFIGGTLVVPRFVLEELQHIADSSDVARRNRGRRGLEVLNRLQRDTECAVEVLDIDVDNAVGVDAKLVRLAQTLSCPIITNDYNLNHVAQIQGVEVLNVNVLANALRPAVIPGEDLSIRIVQEGKERDQGLGYLEDGTMVVVENGRQYLDRTVDVTVTKALQTAAGLMIFARAKAIGNGARP